MGYALNMAGLLKAIGRGLIGFYDIPKSCCWLRVVTFFLIDMTCTYPFYVTKYHWRELWAEPYNAFIATSSMFLGV